MLTMTEDDLIEPEEAPYQPVGDPDARARRQARLLTVIVVLLALLLCGVVAAFVYVTRPLQPVDRQPDNKGWSFVSAITSWGGLSDQRLNAPPAVSYQTDGSVLVSDIIIKPRTVRLLQFSGPGTPRVLYAGFGNGPGQFQGIYSISVDAAGNIYAADPLNSRVQVLTGAGKRVREIPARVPQAVFVKGDTLYVGEDGSVARYTLTGNLIGRFGTKGRAEGQFDAITGIFVDAKGVIYVADGALNRVQALDASGKVLWVRGTPPKNLNDPDRTFDVAADVTMAYDGNLYVLQGLGSRVTVVDAKSGKVIKQLGTRGSEDGQLLQPKRIAASADGTVLAIADTYNNRVQLIRLRDQSLAERLTSPHAASGLEGIFGLPFLLCVTALLPILIVTAVILLRRRVADRSDER